MGASRRRRWVTMYTPQSRPKRILRDGPKTGLLRMRVGGPGQTLKPHPEERPPGASRRRHWVTTHAPQSRPTRILRDGPQRGAPQDEDGGLGQAQKPHPEERAKRASRRMRVECWKSRLYKVLWLGRLRAGHLPIVIFNAQIELVISFKSICIEVSVDRYAASGRSPFPTLNSLIGFVCDNGPTSACRKLSAADDLNLLAQIKPRHVASSLQMPDATRSTGCKTISRQAASGKYP